MGVFRAKKLGKKMLAFMLAAVMMLPDAGTIASAANVNAEREGVVKEISSAAELAKIGSDSNYPMSGDYKLVSDIDLSGTEWIPLGGYVGTKGTMNTSESNVFSGTFDGDGHVISGLTIDLDGSVAGNNAYGQVGLFSVIAGDSSDNIAEVKNLILSDVDIKTDFSDGLSTVGALAGEVNGYAKVSNIAVINGRMSVNPSGNSDTVGAGGIIGECRTEDEIRNHNIVIEDCYNGMEVSASGTHDGTESDYIYASGIIGRIAYSACNSVTRCLNTATVQYDGYDGNGIVAPQNGDSNYLSTVSDCYYSDKEALNKTTGASFLSKETLTSGVLPSGLGDNWEAKEGCFPVPKMCYDSSVAGYIYLSGISLTFAEGEDASTVKTEFQLPSQMGDVALTWTSDDENVLSIEEYVAKPHIDAIGMSKTVKLTATTENGYTRDFKIIVLPAIEQKAEFDQKFAKVGTPLKVVVTNVQGMEFNYAWTVGGVSKGNTDTYTPTEADLEKVIACKVTAMDGSVSWDISTYFSTLPVVYVDTNDGEAVTSNTVAKDAYIKVQGNEEFNNEATFYEGATTIKGRGNSTWSAALPNGKKPYKLKLGKKFNMLGLGTDKNKHWVLLANMIDHTNMRNEIVNQFSKDIGMEYAMGTTNVVLILNGEYQGVYQLCEHVRVGTARVNVYDWEDMAGEVAEAVCKTETGLDVDALTETLEQDYSWVDGSFTFNGQTYQVADYYTGTIPEFTGGFLLDMDFRSTSNDYKYISTFSTQYGGIPMFFRAPEYAKTNQKMMDYARNYMNAYESAIRSADFTTEYDGKTVHYTDLFDLDSLVQYWYVCEYTNNWDSMKNSTYLYKDLDGKAKMGPAWDYDWAFGNINMYNMTGPFVYDNWHTTLDTISTWQGGFAEQNYQKEQWNIYLVKDPYFVTKAYEYYQKYRPTVIEDIMKDGGKIDQLEAKYQSASDANDAKWGSTYTYSGKAFVNGQITNCKGQYYNDAVASMKTFIKKRMEWMDDQFTSVEDLYTSLGGTVSSAVSVDVSKAEDGVKAVATVNNTNAKYVEFIVNGTVINGSDATKYIPVSDGKAEIVLSDDLIAPYKENWNTVQVIACNTSKNPINGVMNYKAFASEEVGVTESDPGELPQIEGSVSIRGNALAGANLYADVVTESTGELSYQWYLADEKIAGATGAFYSVTSKDIGQKISVKVTCSTNSGSLESEKTSKVKAVTPATDYVIINQVYGGGEKKGAPITHSFVELYNPTEAEIDLTGYKLTYKSGETTGELELAGKIPAKTSFLIRGAANKEYNDTKVVDLTAEGSFDQEWAQVIDNNAYLVTLMNGETVVDAVAVNEEGGEGTALTDPVGDTIISKNKSIRRIAFADTNDNVKDFEVLNYTKLPENIFSVIVPKAVSNGTWEFKEIEISTEPDNPVDPDKPVDPEPDSPADPDKPGNPQPDNPKTEVEKPLPVGTVETVDNAVLTVISASQSETPEVRYKPVNKTAKTIVIPATVKIHNVTYKVTEIADNAFKGNKKLKAITIPEGIRKIGKNAFYGCKNLKKITMKTTVLKKVGSKAFKGIHAKATIKVPKAKKKAYTKLLKKKGQAKTVKIK